MNISVEVQQREVLQLQQQHCSVMTPTHNTTMDKQKTTTRRVIIVVAALAVFVLFVSILWSVVDASEQLQKTIQAWQRDNPHHTIIGHL